MYRLAKVGLAIVIVVSVASTLITPAPSDDVNGVLQQRLLVESSIVRVLLSQSNFQLSVFTKFRAGCLQPVVCPNLLDFVCTLLC